MKKMRIVKYQNHLRKIFHDLQEQDTKENDKPEKIKLIHKDWACKLTNIRYKFIPDFETLKKPLFGVVSKIREQKRYDTIV